MPQHIEITRRIAADNLARAQHAAHEEERLSTELTDLEKWAKKETQRIQDALEAARKKAETELKEVTARLGACQAAMVKAGRDKAAYEYEAREAHGSIKDWCVRAGVDPAALPPLPHPEPLPAVPAAPSQVPAEVPPAAVTATDGIAAQHGPTETQPWTPEAGEAAPQRPFQPADADA
jgi:hypothetical protein